MKSNFVKRLAAGIIDCSIILLSELLLIFITMYIVLVLEITDVNQTIINIITYVIFYPSYFILPWLYYALMECSERKATLGKGFFNLVVIDLYGNKISFFRATLRFLMQLVSIVIFFIGFFMAAFTKEPSLT